VSVSPCEIVGNTLNINFLAFSSLGLLLDLLSLSHFLLLDKLPLGSSLLLENVVLEGEANFFFLLFDLNGSGLLLFFLLWSISSSFAV
jgi:hypothetical protein